MPVNKYLINIKTGVLSENNIAVPNYVEKYNDVIQYEERPSNKDHCPQNCNYETTARKICNQLNLMLQQENCPNIEDIRVWYCKYFDRYGNSTRYPENIKASIKNLRNDAEEVYLSKGGTWRPPPPPSRQEVQLQQERETLEQEAARQRQLEYNRQWEERKKQMPGIYW